MRYSKEKSRRETSIYCNTDTKPTEVKCHRANQIRQEVRYRIDAENPVSFQNEVSCADSFTA